MKHLGWIGGLAILLLAFGCQTVSDGLAPGARAYRDFDAPGDDVWEACTAVVKDLPILEMDRDRGRITTDWYEPSRQGPALEPATEWPGARRETTNQERIRLRLKPADEGTRVEIIVMRQAYTRDIGTSEGDQLDTVTWSLTVPSTRARRVLDRIAAELAAP